MHFARVELPGTSPKLISMVASAHIHTQRPLKGLWKKSSRDNWPKGVFRREHTWELCMSLSVGMEAPVWNPDQGPAKDTHGQNWAQTCGQNGSTTCTPPPLMTSLWLVGIPPLLAEDNHFLPKSRSATWWCVIPRHLGKVGSPHTCLHSRPCSAWWLLLSFHKSWMPRAAPFPCLCANSLLSSSEMIIPLTRKVMTLIHYFKCHLCKVINQLNVRLDYILILIVLNSRCF